MPKAAAAAVAHKRFDEDDSELPPQPTTVDALENPAVANQRRARIELSDEDDSNADTDDDDDIPEVVSASASRALEEKRGKEERLKHER